MGKKMASQVALNAMILSMLCACQSKLVNIPSPSLIPAVPFVFIDSGKVLEVEKK